MNQVKFRFLTILATAFLASCGGGGGGGGGSGASYSLAIPTALTTTPAIGSPSYPATVTDYGMGTVSFAQSTALGGYGYADAIYNAATSSSFQIYPIAHLTSCFTELVFASKSWHFPK